jgi:cysteinyl-tRNA synthetase
MMQLSGEKMSKSVGNLVTIEDFLADHEADVLRMLVLNSNYRSPLKFNDETVGHAEKALERLRSALRPAMPRAKETQPAFLRSQIEMTRQGFVEAMDQDFNTAGALGHLFDLVRAINQARDQGVSSEALQESQDVLLNLTSVLGLRLDQPQKTKGEVEPFIDLLVEVRTELREHKLWDLSDQIRDRLQELGVAVEDSKEGSTWHW